MSMYQRQEKGSDLETYEQEQEKPFIGIKKMTARIATNKYSTHVYWCHAVTLLRRYSTIVHKQGCKEENKQHLFSLAGMDLGLNWAWLPHIDPLLGRLFL
jgi:hypothetical protein